MASKLKDRPHEDVDTWRMPAVYPGMIVQYLPVDGSQRPTPAIVLDRGHDSVELRLFIRDGAASGKGGVRHRNDPMLILRSTQGGDPGCWEYCPGALDQSTLAILADRMESLASRVDALESAFLTEQ